MIKLSILRFNNYIINICNNILQILFTVVTLNKSPFKSISFTILLLIGIISSLIIRLDYIINLLNNLPYELMVSIRLTSALYTLLILFLFLLSIKQAINFYTYYINLNKNDKNKVIFTLYYIYIMYFFLIVLLFSYFNYNSIVSLNINYLDFIYICSLIISFIFGIYYSIYKFNNKEFDLNRTLSLTGKICFISFIVFYISLFIGIRTGIIFDFFNNKLEIFQEIHCEGNAPNNNELNSSIRSGGGARSAEEDSISTNVNTTETPITSIDSSSSKDTITPDKSLTLIEKSKEKAIEAVGVFNEPIKRKPSLINETIQKLDKLSLGEAENNNEFIKPSKLSLNAFQMLDFQDKISHLDHSNKNLLYLLSSDTELKWLNNFIFINAIHNLHHEIIKLSFNYEFYEKLYKPNRELLLTINNYITTNTDNLLIDLKKYPGKLVENFINHKNQNEYSFISLFKQVKDNLKPYSLSELTNKNNPELIAYFSILKIDEFNTWNYEGIRLIDLNLLNEEGLSGYWTNKKFNRIEGIIWDLNKSYFYRKSNFFLNETEWQNYKHQGRYAIFKSKLTDNNFYKIEILNPLNENKWVLNWKNKKLQYLCYSGNVIELSLPTNRQVELSDFYKLSYDLIRFPFDYLIPNDLSSNKKELLDLLEKQYGSHLKCYLIDKINKDEFDSYYTLLNEISFLINNFYLTDKDFSYICNLLNKKVFTYMFPKNTIDIPKDKISNLFESGKDITLFYKNWTEFYIKDTENKINTYITIPHKEEDEMLKYIENHKDYSQILKSKIIQKIKKYNIKKQELNYQKYLIKKLKKIFK
jgi:hypothetical protein